MRDEVLLAYAMNGDPLPPQHGFPLRLVVPGWYGMTSVKWLAAIDAVAEPFRRVPDGVLPRPPTAGGRRRAGHPHEPAVAARPAGVPGLPDAAIGSSMSGGTCSSGRAWSGWGAIERVEVSSDGGDSWADATVGDPASPFAWVPWTFTWDASEPGAFELCCRATDAAGNTQPLEQPWNLHGFSNNMVQRVPVEVRSPA